MEDYFKRKGISASLLKQYAKSPQKARLSLETPSVQTEAFTLGSCFHEMMEDKQTFLVFDENGKPEPDKTFASKLNKEWKAEIMSSNDLVISISQHDDLLQMVNNVKASSFYKGLESVKLETIEEGYFHEFPTYIGKCKPDALYNGADGTILCIDWKTCGEPLNGSVWQTKAIIRKFGYDIQAVHYTETLRNVFNKKVHFFFVMVEKNKPNDVVPVWMNPDGDYYDEVFAKWQNNFIELSESLTTGKWKTLEETLTNKLITL